MNSARIHRIMRCPEISSVGLVGMIILNIETGALQGKIGIRADEWIIANFDSSIRVLSGEVCYHW